MGAILGRHVSLGLRAMQGLDECGTEGTAPATVVAFGAIGPTSGARPRMRPRMQPRVPGVQPGASRPAAAGGLDRRRYVDPKAMQAIAITAMPIPAAWERVTFSWRMTVARITVVTG